MLIRFRPRVDRKLRSFRSRLSSAILDSESCRINRVAPRVNRNSQQTVSTQSRVSCAKPQFVQVKLPFARLGKMLVE